MHRRGLVAGALWLAVVGMACATPASQSSATTASQPAAPKRVTAAILGEIVGVGHAESAQPAGLLELEHLINSGLSILDTKGVRQPRLAEAVPSIENGLWKVLPDGGMETTWHIRPNVRWHDGLPFTADDLVFTATIEQDKGTDLQPNSVYSNIAKVEAIDSSTVTVTFSKIYLWADSLFAVGEPGPYSHVGSPRPKHVLEGPFAEKKASLTTLPFWNSEFVGTGPYKVQEWVKGSHVALTANDQYVLGRPKIDEIEVKFITDQSALVASFLAGAVDVTVSRGLAIDQGLLLRDQWTDGQVGFSPVSPIVMFPQLLPPAPTPMGDVRFRRALLNGADRQQMVDNLMSGLSAVAHSPMNVNPGSADYAAVQDSFVRYDYDPRLAAQLLAEVGLTRGGDGFLREPSGEKPVVEVNATNTNVTQPQAMLALADYWQRLGISTNPVEMSATQLLRNPELLASRPAIYLAQRPVDYADFHSSAIPTAANRFFGLNLARYQNAELDSLADRYRVTISKPDRTEVSRQITRFVTDQAVVLGLFHNVWITAASKRLKNVPVRTDAQGETWIAHEWDLAQ